MKERRGKGRVWVQFLREAAMRKGHDHTLHGKVAWAWASRATEPRRKEGLCCNVTRCDISAGLRGALETEDRRVYPSNTLTQLSWDVATQEFGSKWPFVIIIPREGLS